MLYKLYQAPNQELILDYSGFGDDHCHYPAYFIIKEADGSDNGPSYDVISAADNYPTRKYSNYKMPQGTKPLCDVQVDWQQSDDGEETKLTVYSKSGDVIAEVATYSGIDSYVLTGDVEKIIHINSELLASD